jgi:hypothetical protein
LLESDRDGLQHQLFAFTAIGLHPGEPAAHPGSVLESAPYDKRTTGVTGLLHK